MAELEILEIFPFIMFCVVLPIYVVTMIKHNKLRRFFPGVICLWFVFLFTNIEIIEAYADLFNFFEHFFVLAASIGLSMAMIYEYYVDVIKTTEKTKGGMK